MKMILDKIKYFLTFVNYNHKFFLILKLKKKSNLLINRHSTTILEYNNNAINIFNFNLFLSFNPIGALTHKNYALNYRNWDSMYIENIDICDTFLNEVRMYTDSLKIVRVLPNSNFAFSTENNYISEQSRYFFYGLNSQRLNLPLLNNSKSFLNKKDLFNNLNNFQTIKLDDFFNVISWKKLSNLINIFSTSVKKNFGICAIIGDLLDLETLSFFKILTNKTGSNLLINKTNFNLPVDINQLNFDNQFNYLYNKSNLLFDDYDCYILFNYNLRFENTVLNSKLRRRYIWNNFTNIYIFGSIYNLTYKYNYINNSLTTILTFLNGRFWLSNIILKSKTILLLYGSQFLDRFDIKNNFELIQNYFYILKNQLKLKLIKLDINYLSSGSSVINSFDTYFINCSSFLKNSLLKNSVIYYYLGTNNIYSNNNSLSVFNLKLNDKKNDLTIYQNSHIDFNYSFVNLILPTFSIYEMQNLYFVNCYGLIKISKQVEFNFNKNLKDNIEIFYFLFSSYLKNFYNKNFLNILYTILPIHLYKINRGLKLDNLFLLYKFVNIYFIYSSIIFITKYKNFYKNNIYSFYSKQLISISHLFFNDKSTFDI